MKKLAKPKPNCQNKSIPLQVPYKLAPKVWKRLYKLDKAPFTHGGVSPVRTGASSGFLTVSFLTTVSIAVLTTVTSHLVTSAQLKGSCRRPKGKASSGDSADNHSTDSSCYQGDRRQSAEGHQTNSCSGDISPAQTHPAADSCPDDGSSTGKHCQGDSKASDSYLSDSCLPDCLSQPQCSCEADRYPAAEASSQTDSISAANSWNQLPPSTDQTTTNTPSHISPLPTESCKQQQQQLLRTENISWCDLDAVPHQLSCNLVQCNNSNTSSR